MARSLKSEARTLKASVFKLQTSSPFDDKLIFS
jgi:hypothetical protein